MADLIKKIVYPRALPERTDWLSNIANQARFAIPGANQRHGFIPEKRKQSLLMYQTPTDTGWIFNSIPVTTYTPALFPAIESQTRSFRVARPAFSKPGRSGGPRSQDSTLAFVAAASNQLINSFLMRQRQLFNPRFHNWQDDLGHTFFHNTYRVEYWAAIAQLVGERTPLPNSRKRGLENLWNAHSRSVAVLFEDVEILAAIVSQQLQRIDFAKRRKPIQTAASDAGIFYVELAAAIARQSAAHDQLMKSFRTVQRPPYRHEWLDPLGWVFAAAAFDPAHSWAAIGDLLNSFIVGSRPKLDVRRGDTPLDAWMAFNTEINIPSLAGAYAALFNSFRLADRRITMDLRRVDPFPAFSWLHDVLNLEDAPHTQNRAHWRQIAGAVMNKRRRRRRR
jgi:hypothetical protein